MDIIRKRLEKVDVLPMSPTLLPKLLPKLGDVDTNFDEVVEIIALDPSLTAKLLQICNSAYFGHQTEVNSVAEAVSRVGYQSVHLLVSMIDGNACFPATAGTGLDGQKLWRHCIVTAFNSKFVGESAGVDGNLLFTAGLLHDLGKVILAQDPQWAGSGLYQSASDAASIAKEDELFDCNHAEVGAALLERWKLPAQIVAGVRNHHNPREAGDGNQIAACISVGDCISHSADHPELLELPEFKDTLARLALSTDNLKRWAERLRDHQGLVAGMSRLPV